MSEYIIVWPDGTSIQVTESDLTLFEFVTLRQPKWTLDPNPPRV